MASEGRTKGLRDLVLDGIALFLGGHAIPCAMRRRPCGKGPARFFGVARACVRVCVCGWVCGDVGEPELRFNHRDPGSGSREPQQVVP
jgi:hypothetical protein